MSPGADDLTFTDYIDFTGGLWSRGDDRECAPNGLLECTDAYPLPSGGLRATGKWTAMTTTNIPTNAYVLGIWSVKGGGTQGLLFMATLNVNAGGAGNHTFQLFKLTGSPTAGSWTSVGTVTGCTGWWFGNRMVGYRTGAASVSGTLKSYFNVYSGVAGNDGLYSTDGTTITRTAAATNPIDIQSYQSRLLWAQGSAAIYFTDPGVDTLPDTTVNFTFPLAELGGNIRAITPIEPSDLLCHKQVSEGVNRGGTLLLQGDITAPIIRQMTFTHDNVFMYPTWTEVGLAFTLYYDGVYLYNEGTWTPISNAIIGGPMQPNFFGNDDIFNGTTHGGEPISSVTLVGGNGMGGAMAYGGYWLFAGQDYVWDSRTGAWFKITVPAVSTHGQASHFTLDTQSVTATGQQVVVHCRHLSMQAGRVPLWFMEVEEQNLNRASSYVFTLPLIYQPSYQTQVRQIQYYVYSFVANSTITTSVLYLDNNGVVQTTTHGAISLGAATSHKVVVDTGDIPPSDWVKIRTTVTAPSGEAPMIEKIRVGLQDSHPYTTDN